MQHASFLIFLGLIYRHCFSYLLIFSSLIPLSVLVTSSLYLSLALFFFQVYYLWVLEGWYLLYYPLCRCTFTYSGACFDPAYSDSCHRKPQYLFLCFLYTRACSGAYIYLFCSSITFHFAYLLSTHYRLYFVFASCASTIALYMLPNHSC